MNTSPSHAAAHAVVAPHSTILKILQSGKSGFRQLICIALALFFAQTANAATAAQLKTTIEGYASGTGNLSAAVEGNTVTVTGTKTGATSTLTLDIDADVTVLWKAELSGSTTGWGNGLVNESGSGLLEVQSGKIEQTDYGTAIHISGNAAPLTISGGTVSATLGTAVYNDSRSGTLTISGGTVSTTTGTAVNNGLWGAVNISGGEVSATTGMAVYNNTNGKITVSGNAKITSVNTSSTNGTILLGNQGEATVRLEITGGTIENTAANGNAIYNRSIGAVNISGSPTITGTIMKAYTGGLSVDGSFAPAGKTYTLGFTDISGVAVAGGASHISNFTLANSSVGGINFSLSASGSDLVFLATNGYAVAKSETTYTITKGTGEFADVQGAIDNIKAQANGTDCTIQFGNGTDVLNIGGGSATLIAFDGESNGWGLITLTGKLTSSGTSYDGIIRLSNGASIDSKAQIEATSSGNLIRNSGTGTVTISGGYVKSVSGVAVHNYDKGSVNISGGEVSATTGRAVYNNTSGKITVSGNAKITSANTSSTGGTIYLENQGEATARLEISGGTIENTAADGNAIYNTSIGAVNISGTPDITGRMTKAGTGDFSIIADFAPDGKTYTLHFPNGTTIAVAGGAAFISNFILTSTNINGIDVALVAKDGDLVLAATNGYAVAKNGTIYTITKGAGEFTNVQGAIDNIKTQAGGADCTIQFGNGTDMLDIGGGGETLITFDGKSNGWGLITLTGKLTSASTYYEGIIRLTNDASIDSKAQLTATSSGAMIYSYSNSAITISGGTVQAEENVAVLSYYSEITISGGVVSTATGFAAVYNYANAITISGGTVQAEDGRAVYSDYGAITITGGTMLAKEGEAVHSSYGAITITGGLVFAYGTAIAGENNVIYGDYDATDGDAVIAAWDNTAGNTEYTAFTGDDIAVNSPTTAQWLNKSGTAGIDYANGNNTGFIPLDVTVEKATPAYTTPTGLTATYGQTLANVALTGGWSWMDATASVGAVGAQTHKAKFTPSDTENYNVLENIDVSVAVSKANPTYTIPTGLTATVGQTLANVTLPSGWSWMDATASVGAVGAQTHKAKFTPSDTENYNVLENIDVSVAVSAAVPIFANRENPIIGIIGVQTRGNSILLSNLPSNAKVEVYSLQGKRIYLSNSGNSQILRIQVQTKGIYVVKAGSQTARVVVR